MWAVCGQYDGALIACPLPARAPAGGGTVGHIEARSGKGLCCLSFHRTRSCPGLRSSRTRRRMTRAFTRCGGTRTGVVPTCRCAHAWPSPCTWWSPCCLRAASPWSEGGGPVQNTHVNGCRMPAWLFKTGPRGCRNHRAWSGWHPTVDARLSHHRARTAAGASHAAPSTNSRLFTASPSPVRNRRVRASR